MINQAFEAAAKTEAHSPMLPMSVCVALSQGYIGYDLQNALREELLSRGINKPVATLVTQVEVDANDPAFLNPTKPIGSFFTEQEAELREELLSRGINKPVATLVTQVEVDANDPAFLNPTKPIGSFFTEQEAEQLTKQGYTLKEDAGRGYRRVVASPKPVDIIEKETVKALVDAGQVVITVGGGGIPVIREGNHLRGASAVIDKDWASARLAEMIDADMLIILLFVKVTICVVPARLSIKTGPAPV